MTTTSKTLTLDADIHRAILGVVMLVRTEDEARLQRMVKRGTHAPEKIRQAREQAELMARAELALRGAGR